MKYVLYCLSWKVIWEVGPLLVVFAEPLLVVFALHPPAAVIHWHTLAHSENMQINFEVGGGGYFKA